MVFVAVGTQKFQFDRLLKTIDLCIEKGVLSKDVFAQIGNSTYSPKNYQCKDFLSKDEFLELIEKADLVITHSGVGTIIEAITRKKSVIVMPRLARFGEHVDDHQVQIAEAFEKQNLVLKCDESSLPNVIVKSKTHVFAEYVSGQKKALDVIREYLRKVNIS